MQKQTWERGQKSSVPLDFEMKFNDDIISSAFMEMWVALEVKEGHHR